ncbi:MAG: SurA N-terminal domain-containing protein [Alphaproteobacteria bacterium]|nr:SurA N-terminal domain-containing protein [Alphaproteobacteria bacterium]
MLTFFRQLAKSPVATVLILVLAGAFAIWGINDVFRPVQRDAVAYGDGVTVTTREYNGAVERALNEARQQSGQFLTKQQAHEQGVTAQVLSRLIAQKAMNRIAAQFGVQTPDKMVAEAIRSNESFKSQVTGAFDAETYRSLLQQNGLSEAEFEDGLRTGLMRRQLISATAAGVRAPTSFADFIVAFQSERRVVTVADIPPTVAGQIPAPTDADLKKLYEESKPALKTPEFRKLTLILARNADFEAKVEIPEDKLKAAYEFEKDKRGTPETRSFVQITASSQAAAAEAAKRLAAGEDPAAVAKAVGGTAVPFDKTARTAVPDAVVANAVFGAQAGQTIGPVQGKLAWVAAKITTVTPGSAPSYEQLKPELRANLARDEGMTLLNQATKAYDDAVAGGETPEAAAKASGLVVEVIEVVDKEGRDDNGQPVATLANAKDILETAFAAAQDETSDFTPLGDAGYARVRVDGITPEGVVPFEKVKDRLAGAWRSREISKRMEAVVTRIKEAVAGGKTFTAAVQAEKLRVGAKSQTITRQQAGQGPAAQLGGAIFAAAKGEVVAAPIQGAPVLLVAQVEDILRDDPKTRPDLVEAARAQANELLTNDVLDTFQRAAVASARVKQNDKLIASVLGLQTEDDAAAAK